MQNVVSLDMYKSKKLGVSVSELKNVNITVSEDSSNIYRKLTHLFICENLIDSIESSCITKYSLFFITLVLKAVERNIAFKLCKYIEENYCD